LLTYCHHILSKTDAACTQSKMGVVAYLDGVHAVGVRITRVLHYPKQSDRRLTGSRLSVGRLIV